MSKNWAIPKGNISVSELSQYLHRHNVLSTIKVGEHFIYCAKCCGSDYPEAIIFLIRKNGRGGNKYGNKSRNETTGNTHQNHRRCDVSDYGYRQRIGKHPADQRHRHRSGIGFLSELVCTCRIDVFDLGRHLFVAVGLYALPIRFVPRG